MIKRILFPLLTIALFFTPLATTNGEVGTLDDRVREKVLDNGLRVVVVERHNAPVFFSLISFRVGSCQELPNHSGLSHFLEHMLFKGTKTLGTTDYKKELPIMEELEAVAARIKDKQVALKPWRFDLFEEYATKVRAELPAEVREKVSSNEAERWRATLDAMPVDLKKLPEEWLVNPWTVEDGDQNHWKNYRELLEERIRLTELIIEHKQYISDSEPMDAIYKRNGSKSLNAFTTNDQTTYMVGLPSNCLELWMYLESNRFKDPVFREFYNERDVVQEEYRQRSSNPGSKLYKRVLQTAFQTHPYSDPVIGNLSDIRLTLRSDMEEHFERYYAPNNCQLAIVGDVDANVVFKMAEKYFGPWKASEVAEEVTVIEPEQDGERRVKVEYQAEPRLIMAFHVPVAPHPDSYPLVMADYILSSGRTSRFYKSIFEEQQLTASAPGIWDAPGERYPNLMMFSATPKSPHTSEEVEEAILEELEKLKTEPISDRELEKVRNSFKKYQLNRMASNQWLAFSLSGVFVNRGDWRTITQDFERLMTVKPEDVQRVARKYFTAANKTVATLVKPETSEEGGME